MGIDPVSYVVLLILKVARGQHAVILTDPALREKPAWRTRRGLYVLDPVQYEKTPWWPEKGFYVLELVRCMKINGFTYLLPKVVIIPWFS
jgi:hypothetical protein